MPRCDLHVHSRYSSRPNEWILRKIGVRQSYTQPLEIYKKLKSANCRWVTITDHNTIDGCLSIQDQPDVFISEEVTATFPENECKVHILVWNITEPQHHDIQKLRENIYDLASYLKTNQLAHGIAYPLYRTNGKLSTEDIEKLFLLFQAFQVRNGTRDELSQSVFEKCLDNLSPSKIEEFANRHNITPTHAEPWKKIRFGGSGDYSGLFLGQTWTEVSHAHTFQDFLQTLMMGQATPNGRCGDALNMSRRIYHVAVSYAKERLGNTTPNGVSLLGKMADRFLSGKNPTHLSLSDKIGLFIESVRTGRALNWIHPNTTSLDRRIARYLLDSKIRFQLDQIIAQEKTPERRTFRMASKIVNDLTYRFFLHFLEHLHRGEWMESFESLMGILPISGTVMPYFFSFQHLHATRPFLKQVSKRFCAETPISLQNKKRAWFTDTLEDVNGVARTIRSMCRSGLKAGADITVITSRSSVEQDGIRIVNFQPIGEFELPEYKIQKLSFPPILEMVDYIQSENFSECIISTPGPVCITALGAAKLLGLPTSGIYHTDFPQYAKILTEDDGMETVGWTYMKWFYSQMDLMYVNSNFYKTCWIERGIPAEKIHVLPRGLDTELFNPKHRENEYWRKHGAKGPVLLYVGRVSREKGLEFLVHIHKELKSRKLPFTLAVVGEGPYLNEFKALAPEAIFTGIITGRELGIAYASADLFVFPSTTDTFGNVVIEALASGLPTFVSDVGGPRELIQSEFDGRILPAGNVISWTNAIEQFIKNPIPRETSLQRAKSHQQERSWDEAFQRFWNLTLEI
jgi:glycosyltransferase involved in cell wall biosynthesis